MTELQVKTKKGSLKKFLAMFLAVCVCMTTFQLNGMFVSADTSVDQGDQNVSDSNASKDNAISLKEGENVSLEVNETVDLKNKVNVTPSDALVNWSITSENGEDYITLSGSSVTARKATPSGSPVVVEGKLVSDNAKKVEFKITVTNKDDGNGGNGGNGDDRTPDSATLTPDSARFVDAPEEIEKDKAEDFAQYLKFYKDEKEITSSDAFEVEWASSAPAKVEVSKDGKVTGKEYGAKATITATLTTDSNVQATCNVTVEKDPNTSTETKISVTSVTLDKKTLSLTEGDQAKLTASVMPTNATVKGITWSSSNGSVATVDANGNVTAKKAGTAVITATAKDGSGKADKCNVTVKAKGDGNNGNTGNDSNKPAPVKVSKITLTAKTIYLKTGQKATIGAAVAPSNAANKSLQWKSSNTKVAKVTAKGAITAQKKTGKATITVTAKDGSKKSAKVTVNVVKKATKATKVKLKSSAKMNVGDSLALQATLSPKKATSTLKWSTSDKKVATVSNGVVTAKKAGVATITVKADKKTAKCVITVSKKGAKVTLAKTKATVKVKKTFQIKLKTKGDSIVDCKTSNKKVATVTKKGKITGKKAGKADITVITKKGAVATFKVTVKK